MDYKFNKWETDNSHIAELIIINLHKEIVEDYDPHQHDYILEKLYAITEQN